MTRTTLITLVSNTSSASSPVSSDAATRAPMIPALLISVSMRPSCASMSAAARLTDPSSVTSMGTKRAPRRSAAACPRPASRAPMITVWPSSIRRRAVS